MTRDKIVAVIIIVALAAMIAYAYYETQREKAVDFLISDGISEATEEMLTVLEHVPTTRQKVVIVREEVANTVLHLDGDQLARRALDRAESYRSRLIASGDIQ